MPTENKSFPSELTEYLDSVKKSFEKINENQEKQNKLQLKEKISGDKKDKGEETDKKISHAFNSLMEESNSYLKSAYKVMKESLPSLTDFKKPGTLIKLVGLGSGAPGIMLLGDAINSVHDRIVENKKINASSQSKIAQVLKDNGIKNVKIKDILEETKKLTSEDEKKIHDILVKQNIFSEDILNGIIDQKKKFEEGLKFRNPEIVKKLEEQKKSNGEIVAELMRLNSDDKNEKNLWAEQENKAGTQTEQLAESAVDKSSDKDEKNLWAEQENKAQLKATQTLASNSNTQTEQLAELVDLNQPKEEEVGIGWKLLALLGMGVAGFVVGMTKTFNDIINPFKSVFGSLFGATGKFFKTLLGETKTWKFLSEKASMLKGFFKGQFLSFFEKIGAFGSRISKSSKLLTKILKSFNLSMKATKVFGKVFFKIGRIFGQFAIPLEIGYNIIKGILDGDTIRNKILYASAGILSVITSIPEMIANGLLWVFGSDFRFDFGRDKIVEVVDRITDWVFNNVTVPVGDFLTITVPEYFSKFLGIIDKLKDIFVESYNKIKDKIASAGEKLDIFGWFSDDEEDKNKQKIEQVPEEDKNKQKIEQVPEEVKKVPVKLSRDFRIKPDEYSQLPVIREQTLQLKQGKVATEKGDTVNQANVNTQINQSFANTDMTTKSDDADLFKVEW